MNICRCKTIEKVIDGVDAQTYSKEHLLKITHHGGWIQLWKCPDVDIYWEGTWVGGGGFDNGKFTLRKLSDTELQEQWPEVVR